MAENRELALVLKLVADQFQNELKKSQGSLSSFNNFIKDWKTQLTAAGTALFAIAKSTANYGDELFKTSQKVGIGVEALAGLQHAAKLADVDNQQLQVGLQALSRAMVDAAQRSGEGYEAFSRVGVSATDANGQLRPMQDVLLDLSDVFSASADGAGKTELAMKLLGKSGVELIPLLNGGRASITELMDEARRLGLVISEEDAKASEQFNDELTRLQSALNGVKMAVGTALIPSMSAGAEALTSIIAQMRRLNDETTNVAVNLKNLSDAFGQTRMGQGLMDTFTALGFGHRKGEETTPREQFWFDLMKSGGGLHGQAPGSGVLLPGADGGGSGKPQMGQLADQEKLGKAKLDIFLAENRALEIQNKLAREAAQGPNIDFLKDDRRLQREAEDDAEQERFGQRIVQRTQLEVAIREAAAAQERDQLVQNAQAWMAYDEQVGASSEQRYAHQLDLVRANLAQQTQLTTAESGRLLLAWQNHDEQLAQQILARTTLTAQQKETIELQSLTRVAAANEQASDDIFAGWARGMERYVRDTQSGFGLGADMARRTAQAMEQGFQTFFFDVWDDKIQSMADVLESLGNFAKQIFGTVFGQLATKATLGAFGFGANSGGMLVQRFAMGGPVLGTGNRDTVPALLTPGEFVLSRQDVSDIKRGIGGGGVSVVVNNYSKSEVQASSGRGSDGQQMIYVTVRDAMSRAFGSGDMDRTMQTNYGLNRAGARR